MFWHCQASFQGSCESLVLSDTKSCIREFPKTGFIVYKATDGKSLGARGCLSLLNCKNHTGAQILRFVSCYSVWDVIMMLPAVFSSAHSRASKLCSHPGSVAKWKVAWKVLVCGGTCWQSTAFPLVFDLRSSIEVYSGSLSPVTTLLHLCVHLSMWKEIEKPGISDEDLRGDIPSYRACKELFHRINKVGRNL